VHEVRVLGREGHDRVSRVLSFLSGQWALDGWSVAATLFGTAHPAAVGAWRLYRSVGKLSSDLGCKWSVECGWMEKAGTGVWEDLYWRGEYRKNAAPGVPPWPAVKRASPRVLPRAFPSVEARAQAVGNFGWVACWLDGVSVELARVYGPNDTATAAAAKAAGLARQVALKLSEAGPLSKAA
jgi:hypothetical protein